jgi:multiple sugar transport system permease protein/raffinose/stachyose/melibiose transport system permease protein
MAGRVLLRAALTLLIALWTAFAAGPLTWVAMISLRSTSEFLAAPYALPESWRFDKYATAWTASGYDTYFANSLIVVGTSVTIVTIVGAMAAHCLARYRFPGNRAVYFLIFSTIVLPPQITIIALFQTLAAIGLYDSRTGLVLVYAAVQLPLTVYILESFFARIPADLFDAARIDGYSEWAAFWKVAFPVAMPAIATVVILNTILLWNEFLYAVVLIADDARRTLPLGIQKFMGDQLEDYGMIATGLMIAIIPVVLVYAFFSEKLIQGMTAGAVK